nr:immunoglobulin heavy chain junction region [Mus musculus]
ATYFCARSLYYGSSRYYA